MISHNGIDPVACTHLFQNVLEGNHLLGTHIHQVACKNNEVGFLRIDYPHQLVDKSTVAEKGADMNIGQLQHPIAIKRCRQQRRLASGAAHNDVAPAKEEAIEHHQPNQHGHRQGDLPPQQGPQSQEQQPREHNKKQTAKNKAHQTVVTYPYCHRILYLAAKVKF